MASATDDLSARLPFLLLASAAVAAAFFLSGLFSDFPDFLIGVVFSPAGLAVGSILVIALLFSLYLEILRREFIATYPWVFYRVRVPELNTRTPRGMEEVFNLWHGAFRPPDLYDIYLDGYVQPWFSAEIRGTPEGVTFTFFVPTSVRQLFEAAIYSQYPDAEIEETTDYTTAYPVERLEEDLDLWATEIALKKNDAYPIKTYIDFEDQFAEDNTLIDSMSGITEVVSALNPGEELWVQILFRPEFREGWQKKGEELALKLAGREAKQKPSLVFRLLRGIATIIDVFIPGPVTEKKDSKLDLGVLRLTPGETETVKAIQRNVSKVGFGCLIRVMALGPKGTFARRTRIPMSFGIFRQFTSESLNSFVGDPRFTTSRPTYGLSVIRQRYRKRRALRRYQQRFFRERGYVLNSEELASVFHFPVAYTRTPTLERARAKKGEPPPNVPFAPVGAPEGVP